MLRFSFRRRQVLYPGLLARAALAPFTIGSGVIILGGVAEDPVFSLGAALIFGAMGAMCVYLGLRMLSACVVLGPTRLTALGLLRSSRLDRSSIRAVTLTEAYFGPAIAIEHDQGTSQLPMTVHGSKQATEAMARSIAQWLESERIDTGA